MIAQGKSRIYVLKNNMYMKTKKKYIAPALELHLYQAEIGYVGSIIINPNDNSNHPNGQETWSWNTGGSTGNYFDEGSNNGGQGTGWGWD